MPSQKVTVIGYLLFKAFYKIRHDKLTNKCKCGMQIAVYLFKRSACTLTINDELFSKEIRTMVTPCKSPDKSECIRGL